MMPVDRSINGSGAPGKARLASISRPPCAMPPSMPASILAPDLVIAALALVIESLFGYPAPLFRRLGHPVVWIGDLIGALDRRLNRPTLPQAWRRLNGVLALLVVLLLPVSLAVLVQVAALRLLPRPAALALLASLGSTLLASRSLHAHVAAVATCGRPCCRPC